MRVHIGVIVNPDAGSRRTDSIIPRIRDYAAKRSASLDVRILGNGERIEDVVLDVQRKADAIAIVGGDGSLNGTMNGILNSPRPDTPLAFIPKGKANDTARSIPPLSSSDDLQHLFDPNAHRKVDVARITFADGSARRYMNIASMGLSASSAELASHLPRVLGHYCYIIAAGLRLLREKPYDVRMVMSGDTVHMLSDCRMIAVANGQYFGSGLRIAPNARVDDGLLDVVSVSGISNRGVVRNLPRLQRGTHVDLPQVQQWKVTSVAITTNDRVPIEYDGEIGNVLPVEIRIETGALTWIDPS